MFMGMNALDAPHFSLSTQNIGLTSMPPAVPAAVGAGGAAGAAAGGGCRRRCAGVRVRWRFGRIGGPGSGGLSRRVVGAAELGLGRDTSGGDAGWRAVGVGVAGRQSRRDRWVTNGSRATNVTGGFPRAAGLAAAAGVGGAVASKYGRPRTVAARPPAAGYAPAPASAPAAVYPVPAGFSTYGHSPPG